MSILTVSLEEKIALLNAKMNGYAFTLKHDYSLTDDEIYEITVNANLSPFDELDVDIDLKLLSDIVALQDEIKRAYKSRDEMLNQLCRKRKFTE